MRRRTVADPDRGLAVSSSNESTLIQTLQVIWQRRAIVLATTLLAVLAATALIALTTPIYAASVTIQASTAANPFDRVTFDTASYVDRRMNTYARILTSRPMLEELTRRLDLTQPPRVVAEVPANTELIRVTVEDTDPVVAALAATRLGEMFIVQIRAGPDQVAQGMLKERLSQLEARSDLPADGAGALVNDARKQAIARLFAEYELSSLNSALKASSIAIIEPAAVPLVPIRPNRLLVSVMALAAGLVGGLGLVLLVDRLDRRVRSVSEIQALTRLPIVGTIPAEGKQRERALFSRRSPEFEAVRRLRTQLLGPYPRPAGRTIVLTSAEPGEGKSTILANLAAAAAESGLRVLVVDGDLRLPTQQVFFHLSNECGLSSALREGDRAPVQSTERPNVWVLTSGPSDDSASEILSSDRARTLFARLRDRFDVILIDTPALLAVSDAANLARLADEVVLVVARGKTSAEAVRRAVDELDSACEELSVVVNYANQIARYGYYYTAVGAESAS